MCVLLNVYDLPVMTAFGSHFESVMISKITSTVEAVGNSNVELLGQKRKFQLLCICLLYRLYRKHPQY